MAASSHVPLFFIARSEAEVQKKLRIIQIRLAAKVAILNLTYKPDEKVWVCWYLEPRGHGIVTGL